MGFQPSTVSIKKPGQGLKTEKDNRPRGEGDWTWDLYFFMLNTVDFCIRESSQENLTQNFRFWELSQKLRDLRDFPRKWSQNSSPGDSV